MNTTTHHPLDLRPLLDLRGPAEQLIRRLEAGDLSAVSAAEALLRAEREHYDAAVRVLERYDVDDLHTVDAIGLVITQLGTGDLGAVLDEVAPYNWTIGRRAAS